MSVPLRPAPSVIVPAPPSPVQVSESPDLASMSMSDPLRPGRTPEAHGWGYVRRRVGYARGVIMAGRRPKSHPEREEITQLTGDMEVRCVRFRLWLNERIRCGLLGRLPW